MIGLKYFFPAKQKKIKNVPSPLFGIFFVLQEKKKLLEYGFEVFLEIFVHFKNKKVRERKKKKRKKNERNIAR